MDFTKHYFNKEKLQEGNWMKSSYFSNLVRKLAGSGKRKVNPEDFARHTFFGLGGKGGKGFTQLSPGGFAEIYGIMNNRYDNREKLKFFIKNLYSAIIDTKKWNPNNFEYKDDSGKVQKLKLRNPKQIKASSFYETNKGGRILLINVADEEGKDRYFIGLDGNAVKFWVAPKDKGGLGKDFRTWLAAQAAATYKPDMKSISPEFKGKGQEEEQSKADVEKTTKVKIDKSGYDKLVPIPIPVTASYKYPKGLLDLMERLLDKPNEVLIEKAAVQVYKDGETWKNIQTDKEITEIGKNKDTGKPIEDYVVYTNKKDYEKDLAGQKEFNKKFGIEEPKEEPKGEPNKIGDNRAVKIGTKGEWYFVDDKGHELDKVSDEDFKKGDLVAISKNNPTKEDVAHKGELNKEIKAKGGPTKSSDETTGKNKQGELYKQIKDICSNCIEKEPSSVKGQDDAKDGWRYELKDKGVIFVYQSTKDNNYYISYNKPAEKIAKQAMDKLGIKPSPKGPSA